MNEDSQSQRMLPGTCFHFHQGAATPYWSPHWRLTWISLLSVALSSHSPLCLWTHPSQGSLSSATYIQPEGTASDTLGSSQRNQIPADQIMFILQILTSFLHRLRELLHEQNFYLCFFLQRIFSQQRMGVWVEVRGG